ncbi:MAG: phycobilisome rod-core linker polypeptide, partial [Thermosynechococcaceae cyanobacterium]
LCVQRLLGRQVYNERETLAWSIVLATNGLKGFITELLDSDEYINHFGVDTVPYQRRRVIPQRTTGDLTFAHTARYSADYRDKLPRPSRQDHFRASEVGGSRLKLSPDDKRLLGGAIATLALAALWLIFHTPAGL